MFQLSHNPATFHKSQNHSNKIQMIQFSGVYHTKFDRNQSIKNKQPANKHMKVHV